METPGEDPSLRIESFAIINLCGVSTKLYCLTVQYFVLFLLRRITMPKPDKEETKEKSSNETNDTSAKREETKKPEPKNEPEMNSKDTIKENPKTTAVEKTKVA